MFILIWIYDTNDMYVLQLYLPWQKFKNNLNVQNPLIRYIGYCTFQRSKPKVTVIYWAMKTEKDTSTEHIQGI